MTKEEILEKLDELVTEDQTYDYLEDTFAELRSLTEEVEGDKQDRILHYFENYISDRDAVNYLNYDIGPFNPEKHYSYLEYMLDIKEILENVTEDSYIFYKNRHGCLRNATPNDLKKLKHVFIKILEE